jgi:hypothetical protein
MQSFSRSAKRASVPHAGHPSGCPDSLSPSPGHGALVHLFLSLLGIACVRCTHDLQPASLRSHRSGMTPARIGGPGHLGSGRHVELSKCGELRGTNDERRIRAGGAAGTRTPDLRRAKAALSQLSYGPSSRSAHRSGACGRSCRASGGRAWTRTRDLGLIRAAL